MLKTKLDFFIKSNSILHRYSNIDDIIIAHIDALRKAVGCEISIIVGEQVYGKSMAPVKTQTPVMSRFNVQNGCGVNITDGVIIFWNKHLDEFATIASSQIDIVVNSYLLKQNLHYLATRDGLTALYNRREFMTIFAETLTSDSPAGFLLLDIDKFKTYNDTYGHPAGDELLQQLSQLLQSITRKTDVVGRLGGEEFGVLVKDVNEDVLSIIAEKIRSTVQADLMPPKTKRQVTLSIGGSFFPAEGITTDELYKLADVRLYVAKENGRNRAVLESV